MAFRLRQLKKPTVRSQQTQSELFQRLRLLYSAIVDADTTTLITYGSQEGVAVGYIPKRRHGQSSYAPILCSEGRSGLSLGMELIAGNVHASKEAWAFLQSMLELAIKSRLPAIYDERVYVEVGGLMSYGTSLDDLHRHAAIFVDKILKGRKPAELPVEQPTKFELVINLKTAKGIGITIPPVDFDESGPGDQITANRR